MGKVTVDMSMSLDGFITGANASAEQGLGEGGERLHEWLYNLESWRERHGLEGGEDNQDAAILAESFENVGAIVMGRNMFSNAEKAWGDNPPFHMPVFVVTHEGRATLTKQGGTTFTFVTSGFHHALVLAKAAAGDKDVSVAGGANIIQQFFSAGLVDEIQVHIAPILLGKGRRLFQYIGGQPIELERIRAVESPCVSHIKFRVVKS